MTRRCKGGCPWRITRSPLSDRELWETSAALLELHGERVGDVIVASLKKALADHDQEAGATWFAISDRVQQLYDPRTPAGAH